MATLYKTDGTKVTVKGTGKRGALTLEQMQEAVGGFVEVVAIPYKAIRVLVNEEGRFKGLPLNEKVSAMVGVLVVGDALVADAKEIR